ncbi:MAG: acyltransferase domain-containing protein [Solirubrobacterales bacterium]
MDPDSRRPCLVGLWGETQDELRAGAAAASKSLRGSAPASISAGLGEGGIRLLARGADAGAVSECLAAFASGEPDSGVEAREQAGAPARLAFVFAGQSEVRAGMGAELYRESPCFAEVIDRCSLVLGETLGTTLAAAVYDADGEDLLDDARLAQPALFALQVALVALWRRWGVAPEMVSGHSLGEYAAACAAGAFGLEDGMLLVGARGALTASRARRGLMAVVFADEERVAEALVGSGEGVSMAAVNAPGVVVVSGEEDAVTASLAALDALGIGGKPLHISHPFHSACVDPMLDGLEEVAAKTPMSPPGIPFASALKGGLLEPDEPLDAAYWRRHAREPVRFLDATRELARAGCTAFLELGPHATLTGLGPRCVEGQATTWLPSLKRTGDDRRVLADTAAKLWLAGVDVDLAAMADDCGWDLLAPSGVAEGSGVR